MTGQAAVAELAELVADLKGGGFLERGRILARGARVLRGLTPKQRRTVAIEIARRAAPQLVENITAEGGPAGDVDLSPAQVKAVFDMVARLDEEGAGDLAATLRDPEWQQQALGLAATEGFDAVAASAGYDEVGTLLRADPLEEYEEAETRAAADALEPPVPEEEATALATAAWDPDGGENIGTELEPRSGPGPPPGERRPQLDDRHPGPAEAAAEVERLRAEAQRLQADAEAPPDFAGPPATYEPTMPELSTYEPTGIDPSLLSFDTPSTTPGQARPSEDAAPERSWFGGGELGIAELVPERTPLSQRLVDLERPSHRLRLINDVIDDVAAMETDEQVGVLLALPDGWVRRRALHRLLEADGISRKAAPRLLRTLGRETDRAWVAASMVEGELVLLDDVAEVLSDRSRARLRTRYEREGS